MLEKTETEKKHCPGKTMRMRIWAVEASLLKETVFVWFLGEEASFIAQKFLLSVQLTCLIIPIILFSNAVW